MDCNEINKPCSKTATITMTGDAKCRMEMVTTADTVTGDCMVARDTAALHTKQVGRYHSMGTHKRSPDGAPTGTWTPSTDKGMGRETLTPIK